MDIKEEIANALPSCDYKDGTIYYNGYRVYSNRECNLVVSNIYGALGNHIIFRPEEWEQVIVYLKETNEALELYNLKEITVTNITDCCTMIESVINISCRVSVTIYLNNKPVKRFARVIDVHTWGDKLNLYNCNCYTREFEINEITSVVVEFYKLGERRKIEIKIES